MVDYYSKLPVVKQVDSLLAKDPVQAANVVYAEFGMPRKLVSDAGMNVFQSQLKIFTDT